MIAFVIAGVTKKAIIMPTTENMRLAVDLLSPLQNPTKKPITKITTKNIDTIQPIADALI